MAMVRPPEKSNAKVRDMRGKVLARTESDGLSAGKSNAKVRDKRDKGLARTESDWECDGKCCVPGALCAFMGRPAFMALAAKSFVS
jgi:hypothetical protein